MSVWSRRSLAHGCRPYRMVKYSVRIFNLYLKLPLKTLFLRYLPHIDSPPTPCSVFTPTMLTNNPCGCPMPGPCYFAVGAFDGYQGGVAQQYKVCAHPTLSHQISLHVAKMVADGRSALCGTLLLVMTAPLTRWRRGCNDLSTLLAGSMITATQ